MTYITHSGTIMIDLIWKNLYSLFRTYFHLYLLILSMFIQALGAICTKYAALSDFNHYIFGIRLEYLFFFLIVGLMGLQVLTWQGALRFFPLSFAYSFRSLVSFPILFSAFVLFHESITLANIIGLVIITIGVIYLVHDKEILL
jgi:drug/metabolite transporter (DMT)-like permease